jgi:hypothetical protein
MLRGCAQGTALSTASESVRWHPHRHPHRPQRRPSRSPPSPERWGRLHCHPHCRSRCRSHCRCPCALRTPPQMRAFHRHSFCTERIDRCTPPQHSTAQHSTALTDQDDGECSAGQYRAVQWGGERGEGLRGLRTTGIVCFRLRICTFRALFVFAFRFAHTFWKSGEPLRCGGRAPTSPKGRDRPEPVRSFPRRCRCRSLECAEPQSRAQPPHSAHCAAAQSHWIGARSVAECQMPMLS